MTERIPRLGRMTILAATCTAMLGAASIGCGVDENLYNAAVKDRDEQKQKLATTEDQLNAERAGHKQDNDARDARIMVLENKLKALGQDVSRLEDERAGLGGELDQAKKRMEELRKAQAQAEARAAQFRKLVTQFKSLTEAGKLQVEIRENRMIVRLGDKILFDPGKTELKPEGKDALKEVTAVLKEIPNRNFQVAGHTDNIPIKSKRFRSNWELSTQRAVEVTNFMIASGMDPKRLSAAGYADQSPVAPNDTPENKAKNRRIEITLVPNLDDLPPIDEALKSDNKEAEATPAPAPAAAPAAPAAPAAAPRRGTGRDQGRRAQQGLIARESATTAPGVGVPSSPIRPRVRSQRLARAVPVQLQPHRRVRRRRPRITVALDRVDVDARGDEQSGQHRHRHLGAGADLVRAQATRIDEVVVG